MGWDRMGSDRGDGARVTRGEAKCLGVESLSLGVLLWSWCGASNEGRGEGRVCD